MFTLRLLEDMVAQAVCRCGLTPQTELHNQASRSSDATPSPPSHLQSMLQSTALLTHRAHTRPAPEHRFLFNNTSRAHSHRRTPAANMRLPYRWRLALPTLWPQPPQRRQRIRIDLEVANTLPPLPRRSWSRYWRRKPWRPLRPWRRVYRSP